SARAGRPGAGRRHCRLTLMPTPLATASATPPRAENGPASHRRLPHVAEDARPAGGGRSARGQRRSPIRWSLRRLVVPVTHMGAPEMITTVSPAHTVPSPSSVASASSIISSVVSTFRQSRELTPHESPSRRWTSTRGVRAMIGTSGRSWDMSRAENPDCVNATMTLAPRSSAAWRAASDIASGKPTTAGRHLATAVAPGHPGPADAGEDAREGREHLGPLELRHGRDARTLVPEKGLDLLDVGPRADVGARDEVDAGLDAEPQVGLVLRRQTGLRDRHTGQEDPLVVADDPARGHPAAHLVRH